MTASTTNKCKRKRCLDLDDTVAQTRTKHLKRIIRALTVPSYLLGLGANYVRLENRNMLRCLLPKLVRHHNWAEASGVLSMFLKGTYKDRSPATNRFKFPLLMEIVNHMERNRLDLKRIKNMYDIWIGKIGSMKRFPVEVRSVVRVEFILFSLTQVNVDEAYQNALSLMQEYEFENDGMSNMILGLTFFQLWYSNIPKQLQHRGQDELLPAAESDMPGSQSKSLVGSIEDHNAVFSGKADTLMQHRGRDELLSPAESDMPVSQSKSLVGSIEDHNAVFSGKADTSMQCDSETSVRNDRRVSVQADHDLHKEAYVGPDDYKQTKFTPQDIRPQGFYINSIESAGHEASLSNHGGHKQYGSVFSAPEGLDSWLLPIQLPDPAENLEEFIHLHEGLINNDRYRDAVKYLQRTLDSTPPVFAALLPLVQLLLIGDKVVEAMKVLEKYCSNSDIALPMRIRASLLELHVDHNNHVALSTSFENVLKKDPTCTHSLAKLVIMHENGYYSLESLVEMIALHLDATYAEPDTWKELALCFLGLGQNEEDRMSVCQTGKEGEKQYFSFHYSRTRRVWETWRLRCRWWKTRHFSKNMLLSEIAAGDLELLAYKAACASQMYGQGCGYVVKAQNCLETENSGDLLDFLATHIQNPIKIAQLTTKI